MHTFAGYRGCKRKSVVSFAWLFLSLLCSGCWSATEDAAKLEEVKSVWARLPSYPGMQETDSTTTSGYGKAMVSKKFSSNARYDEVRRFYVERLEQDGWKIYGEKQLKGLGSDFGGYEIRFRKSDLSIAIEYAGEKADYGWQYAIAVSWSRWVKDASVRAKETISNGLLTEALYSNDLLQSYHRFAPFLVPSRVGANKADAARVSGVVDQKTSSG